MKQDWKQLYGPVPESFEHAVREAVAEAPARRVRCLPKLAVVLTVTLVLMLGTAYAVTNYVGLLDTLTGIRHLHLRDGAKSMLVPELNVAQYGENPYAEFTVLEALCDEYKTWMQIKITPKGNAVIITEEARPWYHAYFDSQEVPADLSSPTFADLAVGSGGPLVAVDLMSNMTANQYLEDGCVIVTQSMDASARHELTIKTRVVPPEEYGEGKYNWPYNEFRDAVSLSFDVPVLNEQVIYSEDMDLWLESLQIMMKRVSFIETPVACYLRLEYEPGQAVRENSYSNIYGIGYQEMLNRIQPSITVSGETYDYYHPIRPEEWLYEKTNAYLEIKDIPMDFEVSLSMKGYSTSPDGKVELTQDMMCASFPVHLEKIE